MAIRVNQVLVALKKKEGFIIEDNKLSVLLAGIESEFQIEHAVLSKDSKMTYDAARVYVSEHCKRKHEDAEKLRAFAESQQQTKTQKTTQPTQLKNQNARKKKKFQFKCFSCRKMGHRVFECKSKLAGKQEEKRETILALFDELHAMELESPGRRIMIDTGCTRHICGSNM